jgi:uncharacterized phage protein (TIGR02220 family)
MKKPTGYSLSRKWFDWCFDNTEKVTPCHTAMYFFIIEHWNRMGWKETFGLPMSSTKDAIGIKNFRTYTKTFNDLVEWGFIKVVQRSKNQYTANIIAIVQNTMATTKALDKALHGHVQKQRRGTYNGTVYIDKPITLEPETIQPDLMYDEYLLMVREVIGRNFKGDPQSRRQFTARTKEGYKIEDFRRAVEAAKKQQNHIDSKFKYLTPEFFTRVAKLNIYAPEEKELSSTTPIPNGTNWQ